jgi:xylulokinase
VAIRSALATSSVSAETVAGVSFTTQMLGVVLVSSEGEPLRPAIIWMDGRADRQARKLTRKMLGPGVVRFVAGADPSGKDVVPKLLWLRKHDPATFARAETCLDVKGYLLRRCTGRNLVDWTTASATGLLTRRRTWSSALRVFTRLPRKMFPRLLPPTAVAGRLRSEAAGDLGLPHQIPVIAGAGDVIATAVGVGAAAPGAVHLHVGTSGWVAEWRDRHPPRQVNDIAVLQGPGASSFLRVAETEAAGACLEWFAATFYGSEGRPGHAEVASAAATAPAGSGGLLYAPWLFGERAPVNDVFARAGFINLGPEHSIGHLARAVHEGVAFNLRSILDAMALGSAGPVGPLRVGGGAAQSAILLQALADITQRPVQRARDPQLSGAVGAGLLAAVGLGYVPSTEAAGSMVKIDKTFAPDSTLRSRYDELYRAFQDLYPSLRSVYHRLNDVGQDR